MSAADEPSLHLAAFLPYRLSVLSNRVSNAIATMYEREFALTIWQWRVLAVVAEGKGLTASQVAERTAMDKVAVSRAVAKLIESGRLRRKALQSDGRASQLELTRQGRETYRQIVPRAKAYEATLLEGLAEQEIKVLESLLDRLTVQATDLTEAKT